MRCGGGVCVVWCGARPAPSPPPHAHKHINPGHHPSCVRVPDLLITSLPHVTLTARPERWYARKWCSLVVWFRGKEVTVYSRSWCSNIYRFLFYAQVPYTRVTDEKYIYSGLKIPSACKVVVSLITTLLHACCTRPPFVLLHSVGTQTRVRRNVFLDRLTYYWLA